MTTKAEYLYYVLALRCACPGFGPLWPSLLSCCTIASSTCSASFSYHVQDILACHKSYLAYFAMSLAKGPCLSACPGWLGGVGGNTKHPCLWPHVLTAAEPGDNACAQSMSHRRDAAAAGEGCTSQAWLLAGRPHV